MGILPHQWVNIGLMIKGMYKKLNEPFPSKESLRSSVVSNFYVALFIAGFLFLIKPFGMRNAPNPFSLALAFGAVSFLFSLSFDLFCRYVLRIKTDMPSWTLWKWLTQSFLLVSWIAFGNYVLQLILFWEHIGGGSFFLWLEVWKATLTLGSIPIFVSGLLVQMQAIKANVRQADGIELPNVRIASGPSVEFALSSSEPLMLAAKDLLFVEAMQNYVQMHVVDGDSVSRHIVRNTVAKTLERFQQAGASNIIRCHRSYLVNIDKIESVKGNAQGLKLNLISLTETLIPVSRSYISEFKQALELATRPTSM